MAQALAPLVFGLLIDAMGSRVLIVSSALSLSALLALFFCGGSRRNISEICAMGDQAAASLCAYFVGADTIAGLSSTLATLRPKSRPAWSAPSPPRGIEIL